jgi:putative transcriptional regulator
MNPYDARILSGLTQADFARLFGIHAMTVSKWERGVAEPTPYQTALLQRMWNNPKRLHGGKDLQMMMMQRGPIEVLAYLIA